jgi:hypothetical protein
MTDVILFKYYNFIDEFLTFLVNFCLLFCGMKKIVEHSVWHVFLFEL